MGQEAEALRLAGQDVSQREIARRTGLSRYRVGRLVADQRPADRPTTRPDAVGHPETAGRPADHAADGAAAASRPDTAPALPRRVADPLAGMDVSGWRALRRDLAVLRQSGLPAEALVHQAVTSFAYAYGQALARGELQPGRAVLITGMTLRPGAHLADRPAA